MILDVGCGSFHKGDVNCDLFIKDAGHRLQEGKSINVKNIKNFVLCDSKFLPFRNSSFDVVYSSHVIEHVPEPVKVLDEMVRVSSSQVELLCPHWLGDKLGGKNPYHLSKFRVKWFAAYAKNRQLFCRCRITRYFDTKKGFGIVRLLRIPHEIHVLFGK
ncbi:MAG: hypothetical protein CW691_07245 [Candidatus Bathyarchaeum sp.]|nr:MAG: hypothetical protein CW691_07245 [Candidatus Bathyarchaeum sp.]